jgi:hypothetical protein
MPAKTEKLSGFYETCLDNSLYIVVLPAAPISQQRLSLSSAYLSAAPISLFAAAATTVVAAATTVVAAATTVVTAAGPIIGTSKIDVNLKHKHINL